MRHDFLDICAAKLHRAKLHLCELEDKTGGSTMDRHAIRGVILKTRAQPNTNEVIVRYEEPRRGLLECEIIIGEIVHQLRSTLDYLAGELVSRGPPGPKVGHGHVVFPVFRDKGEYQAEGLPKIKGVSNEVAALIEALQPFGADDPRRHPLDIIQHMWNREKHRLPNVSCASLAGYQVFVRSPLGDEHLSIVNRLGRPLKDGAILYRRKFPPEVSGQVEVECMFAPTVIFNEPHYPHEPVIPFLSDWITLVANIVDILTDASR